MTKFTFYKNNRVDQEFDLDEKALREHFRAYIENKPLQWVKYYWPQIEDIFVMEHLEAVSEPKEVPLLRETLNRIKGELWEDILS